MGIVLLYFFTNEENWREPAKQQRKRKKNWKRKLVLVLFIRRSYLAILSSRLYSDQWFKPGTTGKSEIHCSIKENLLIRDLKPALKENVNSEKLFLLRHILFKWTNSDISKFILGCEAWGNRTKNHLEAQQLINKYISFVLFPQASEPSMNFNVSKMVYWVCHQHLSLVILLPVY